MEERIRSLEKKVAQLEKSLELAVTVMHEMMENVKSVFDESAVTMRKSADLHDLVIKRIERIEECLQDKEVH